MKQMSLGSTVTGFERKTKRPGKRQAIQHTPWVHLLDQAERLKARIRAKVEHPVGVIERRFDHVKVRARGLKQNTAQLYALFAWSNLWMARQALLQGARECVRP